VQLIGDLQRQKVLFGEPTHVDIKTRARECNECGSVQRPHECPFSGGQVAKAKPATKPKPAESENKSAEASPSAADKMCRAWRSMKTCARKAVCRFEHPEEHVAEKVCFDFAKSGSCVRDRCGFRHDKPAEAEKQNSAVLVPPPQPAAAGSVPAAAAAPAAKAAPVSRKRGHHESPKKNSAPVQGVNPFGSLAHSSSDSCAVDQDEEKERSASPATPRRAVSLSSRDLPGPAQSPQKKQKQNGNPSAAAARDVQGQPPVSSLSSIAAPSPSKAQPPARAQSTGGKSRSGSAKKGTALDKQ
jgi:hypothetical protein